MPPPLPRQAPPAITSRRQADRDSRAWDAILDRKLQNTEVFAIVNEITAINHRIATERDWAQHQALSVRDALADGFIGAAIGALDKLDARLINIGRLEVDLAAKLDELGKVERKDVVLADEDADKLRFIEDERRKRGGRPGPDGGAA